MIDTTHLVLPQAIVEARYASHLLGEAIADPADVPSRRRAVGLMACEFLELAIRRLGRL